MLAGQGKILKKHNLGDLQSSTQVRDFGVPGLRMFQKGLCGLLDSRSSIQGNVIWSER